MDGNTGNHLVMNLILRPLENVNDPVWAVMLGQNTGADIGGEIATMQLECDED